MILFAICYKIDGDAWRFNFVGEHRAASSPIEYDESRGMILLDKRCGIPIGAVLDASWQDNLTVVKEYSLFGKRSVKIWAKIVPGFMSSCSECVQLNWCVNEPCS